MPRQVLVLSHRGELLEGLLKAALRHPVELVPLAGPEDLAGQDGALAALVVLDATGPHGVEQVRQGALLRSTLPPCPWVVLVPEDSAALRQALAAGFQRVVLDPINLDHFAASCHEALFPVPQEQPLDALGVVLRGLNHEVRNPLASISGLLQLLAHEEPQESDRGARYRKILGEVGRIQVVLDEFSHFLRHQRPARECLEVQQLFKSLEQACRKRGQPLDLTLARSAAGSVAVMADPPAFVRALEALVDYAGGPGEHGAVDCIVTSGPALVEIEIRGHLPRALPKPSMLLFVPYHAASGPGPTGGPALASAYGILRGHEADVEVTATSMQTVEFRVFLPRARIPPTP